MLNADALADLVKAALRILKSQSQLQSQIRKRHEAQKGGLAHRFVE